ncbi:MAG: helix-turn-helix domain-containing protein [Xanthobacteraceae bacterium]
MPMDEEMPLPDRAIAEQIKVSDKTVAGARKTSTAEFSAVEKRTGRDGKKHKTKKTEAKRKGRPPKVPPPVGIAPPQVQAMVLTIPEACAELRLSRASLYRAMDGGQLRYLKYGSSRRIAREDAKAFVDSLRV